MSRDEYIVVEPKQFIPDPVPFPTLQKFWFGFCFRFPIQIWIQVQTILSTIFQKNCCPQSCLFNVRSSIVSQKVIISFIDCFTFLFLSFHFISALDLNPECIAVPVLVPLRQKVSVPSGTGSGSTTMGDFF